MTAFFPPTRHQRVWALVSYWMVWPAWRLTPVSWWYSRDQHPEGWRVRWWVYVNAEMWFWDERWQGRI